MKLQLLLFLLIFIIPVNYAFADFSVTTDKAEYLFGETIYITGEVSEYKENYGLSYVITDSNNYMGGLGYPIVNSDKTFNIDFLLDHSLFKEPGIFTIKLQYGADKIETTFELIPHNINIQSDKADYYKNENILINGTVSNIYQSKDATISYNISRSDDTLIQSDEDVTLDADGTFDFIISTTDWDFEDYITVDVTAQDSTASTSFNYYNTPNTENDSLYSLITENTSTLEDQHYTMDSYNNTLTTQSLQITTLQEELQSLRGIFTILNNTISDEFPIELNGVAINKVTNENRDLESEIIFLESQIEGDLIRLEDAKLGGNEIRIDTLTKAIGSHKVLIFLAQNKLDIAQFNIDRYDLLPE